MQIVVQGTKLFFIFFCALCGHVSVRKDPSRTERNEHGGLLEQELTCMFTRKVNIPLSAATYNSKGSVEIIM
jgi:hypothetical protein